MKTLTLTQPWASLVAAGVKSVETRSWGTDYRGPLAIHAAKAIPAWVEALMGDRALEPRGALDEACRLADLPARVQDMPRGAVIAVATLHTVIPTSEARAYLTAEFGWDPHDWLREQGLGDFSPGRYAWVLTEIAPLPTPEPARGQLGLWDWNPAPEENT